MVIIFFKKNIRDVKQLTKSPDTCAFWFTKGLSSYKYIDTVFKIESIKIEEAIYEDFKTEYPQLIEKYKVEVFKTTGSSQANHSANQKICFFASNDTILNSFYTILKNLNPAEYEVFCRNNEGAGAAAQKLGIKSTDIKFAIPNIRNYSLLVMGNDWGPLERKINLDFISNDLNSVCIQESSIDFNPIYGKMRNTSFQVFQGVATLENIDVKNKITSVIGNPRFEQLKPSPLPPQKLALVNVNFTYGVFEEYRNIWVNDVVDTCKELDINYVLSQHPRDGGDFTGYNLLKSNPLLVHDTIRDATVVISRFSALLTEAIALGRPAIYYNPHGENHYYKFTADNTMLFYTTSKAELNGALKKILEIQAGNASAESDFLEKHLGNTTQGKASQYITLLLKDLVTFEPIKKASIFQLIKIRLQILKLILQKRSY